MDEYNHNGEPLGETEPELFGRSKSREEIREEHRAEKQAERDRRRREAEARKAAGKAGGSQSHEALVMVLVMGALLVIVGAVLGFQIYRDTKNEQYEASEENTALFEDEEEKPELSTEGLTAAVNKVYYTKGGHLCVKMTLGNGLDKEQHMSSLEVAISNGESEELIAQGYTGSVSEKYTVPAGGYNTYTFYISPEFVKITDDPLTVISYSITAKGYYDAE